MRRSFTTLALRSRMTAQGALEQNNQPDKLKFAGRARFRMLAYRLVASKRSAAKRRGRLLNLNDKLKFGGELGGLNIPLKGGSPSLRFCHIPHQLFSRTLPASVIRKRSAVAHYFTFSICSCKYDACKSKNRELSPSVLVCWYSFFVLLYDRHPIDAFFINI